jgi:hypothetical protein
MANGVLRYHLRLQCTRTLLSDAVQQYSWQAHIQATDMIGCDTPMGGSLHRARFNDKQDDMMTIQGSVRNQAYYNMVQLLYYDVV